MDTLKKNDIYTADISGFTSEGLGVAHICGRTVFVRGALPSETWRIRIVKTGKSVCYGRGEECLSPAEGRVEPDCPVYGRCGGCACRHMSYELELEFKRQKVNDALRRIGGADIEVDGILASPLASRYRNKAIFAVGGSASEPVYGFFRAGSHDVVPVDDCPLQSELSSRCARTVCTWMRKNSVAPYVNGAGLVRHVFTRTAKDGSAVCCIVSAGGFGARTQSLVAALREACPELRGVVLNINRTSGNTVLAGDFYTLWGEEVLCDELCGFKYRLSPQSFYQVNRAQAERLYERAVELALPEPVDTVLELYCGAGTISLPLSCRARRVIGAEIVPEAVENARANAEANGVRNAEFICADAGEAADRFAESGVRPDVIVVDPPRKGMSERAVAATASMQPERIVYVSCDPATLARDISRFSALGYRAERATAVDMFPRTSHVETVVLLSKGIIDSKKVRVEFSLEDMDMSGFRKGATYQQIKDYVLDHTGLKVSTLYIAQVKQKYGIIERENYNKPKFEDTHQPQCPPGKEAVIMDALRHFGMIE